MTEEEWQTCPHPDLLLDSRLGPLSDRKPRLFAVACCRRISRLNDGRLADYLAIAEDIADGTGLTSDARYSQGQSLAFNALNETQIPSAQRLICKTIIHAAFHVWLPSIASSVAGMARDSRLAGERIRRKIESRYQAELLRDIFGNPFRPVAFDPAWRKSPVVSIAQALYDSRDFAPMPVLADALQDAGCEQSDILDHCRAGQTHVRGCWVVDLILGKE